MGASGEEIRSLSGEKFISPRFEDRHISGHSCRVAGNIDDSAGGHLANAFNGIGIEALSGRVNYHDIGPYTPAFQLQGGFAGIATEKFCVAYAVADGIFTGIVDRFCHYFHTDNLFGSFCHCQSNSAYTAVEV